MRSPKNSQLVYFILAIAFLSSCVSKKNVNYIYDYVQEAKELETLKYEKKFSKKLIEPRDKLYIDVYSLDPKVIQIFDRQGGGGNQEIVNLNSYLVNDQGYIDFPFIGEINLQGKDLKEASVLLSQELSQYFTDVTTKVRYVGNTITVIGEVNRQGEYQFYDEKISIFQALSYAGGMNNFGNKSNVVVMRESKEEIEYIHLDLTKSKIANSEDYYLQPNDIIVVAPIKARYRTYRDFALINMVLSGVTTLILIINHIDNLQEDNN